jgi:asparagine synthase (glutamine-hydrolysing)
LCGICGIYNFDMHSPVDESLVRAMTGLLVHRGPDDDGYYIDGSIGFGQRRLSIIDPTGGHQPLANEDRSVWITYNGEIYNFPELMDGLSERGHRFQTRSDTEVVVHAYEEYGLDFLPLLNGMYAFALWDQRERRLLLARDPFGVKPLYVWQSPCRLAFASEIKAFLADPEFPREIDLIALDQYLTFQFVPSPRTLFKGVQKVQPGHCLIVDDGGISLRRFDRRVPCKLEPTGEANAIAALQEHLFRAIERQMISDVPVGALLSGGVDSATVVAIMKQVTEQPVKTFTVGFRDNFAKNELATARRSAQLLGTEHHDVIIGAKECLDSFSEVIWHLDEPIATPSIMAMYWVSRLAAQHVKVVLTGQGADEPWAGYRRYTGEKLGSWYRRIPAVLRGRLVEPLVGRLPRAEFLKRAVCALGTTDPVQRFVNIYTMFTPVMKKALYRSEVAEEIDNSHGVEALRYWQLPVAELEPLAQELYVETRFSLSDNLLLYGDKLSMAASLEVRVPMLDLGLMSFVESLPLRYKLKGFGQHKYLYRKAIARWLPDEVLRRPKVAFETPLDDWFQREITGRVRERLTAPDSACARYFEPAYIGGLIRQHAERREDHTRALFSLLVFEHWHERFVDHAHIGTN